MSNNISRIKSRFAELESRKEKALIAYVMVGYPNKKSMMQIIRGLIRGGADVIELGFPFSDPLADGPVIQNASTVSLKGGMKIKQILSLVRQIRKESQIPLVLMTYTNILYHQGYDRFFKVAKAAGIDGLITPDMTVEESKEYLAAAKRHNIDTIFLVSPNTSQSRLQKIVSKSTGFLYLVSVFGTTGVQNRIQKYTVDALKRTKRIAGKRIPVGIGFGISTPQDVSNYVKYGADAVIIGSVLIRMIEKTHHTKLESSIISYIKKMKEATRRSA